MIAKVKRNLGLVAKSLKTSADSYEGIDTSNASLLSGVGDEGGL
ncbi:hypothetical protein [Kibdelosporangium aridum]|nr:hypothetical protein [Kibdelosporangium aridum]